MRVYADMEYMLKGMRVHIKARQVNVRLRPLTDVNALKIEHGLRSTRVDGRRRARCEWA